jgi:sulfide dehydrogenase cytochrome subunit
MKRLTTYFAMALISIAFSSANAGDLETLIEDCNGCHGDNGVSQWTDVPTIAGLAEFVHVDALYVYAEEARPCAKSEYRQGDTSRPAKTMCEIAAELSEDDIDALAAVYAELPYVKAKQDFDADLAAAGKTLHEEHCDKCHSDAGTNPEDEAGMLGGQMMGYLTQSFADYASGEREQPGKMKEKMGLLSEDDAKALVHYYGSVQ